MVFKPVTTQAQTQSLLPVYGGKKMQYVFWDAIQLSNTMREYSDLTFEKHLGEGATFTVNLHREAATDDAEPKLVAVKTARLSEASYTSQGPGVDLYALLLEIQILQYEPLQNHPNIINVLGMDWTVIGDGVPAPRLIVEYAQFGTMSEYLQAHSVGLHEKVDLCLDIAIGLQMVHRCGVVHGDMKLPNILVFEIEGARVAKISDFGCALTSAEIEEGQKYRGTRSYHAPELKDEPSLTIEDLRKCDVYAFGLCVWEILKDGLPYSEGEPTAAPEAAILGAGKPLPDLFDMFLETVSADGPPNPIRPDTLVVDDSEPGKFSLVKETQISLKSIFHTLVHRSIHPVPGKRYTMGGIVEILQRLVKPRNDESQETTFLFRRSSAGVWGFSVHTTVPRDAQYEAVATLLASVTSAGKEDKCRILLMLSECYAHGYGVSTDFTEALSYLQQAAVAGSTSAEAVLLRISDAIGGGRDDSLRLVSDTQNDAFQVRQVFMDLEKRLSSLGNTQNFSARLRAWSRIGREEGEKVGFSFTEDGNVFTVTPGTAVNLAHVLELNTIKHVDTPMVTFANELSSGKGLLLHEIASRGWTDLLRSLTKGTDLLLKTVPMVNDYGDISNPGNLLIAAACYGQAQIIKFLLASGMSASRWEGPFSAPSCVNGLHFLFMFEDDEIEEVTRLLVEHGADPNMVGVYAISVAPLAQDFPLELSGPPLDMAITVGDIRAVRVLLKYGANPLQRSGPSQEKQQHNCLELAVALHTYEIVDVLLDHLLNNTHADQSEPPKLNGLLEHVCGLIIGGKGMFRRWLLHGSEYRLACHKTIEMILKYGLSIDTKDDEGLTPLQVTAYASPCQHYVLEALLEHGADPNARNSIGGVPLMQCCRTVWEPEDNARATRTLIKFGADVNVAADDGQFIAHYHASANSTASLRVILEAGAYVECTDDVGVTPLFSAAGAGGVEAVKLLLHQGANIDSVLAREHPQKVTTPLGLAVLAGKTKTVRALLDDGASIIQKGAPGTVLNIATRFKQIEIVRVMLQEYSSIFCRQWVLDSMDSDRHTPLEAAALGGPSFIDLVLQAGADIDFRDPYGLESGTALAATISYVRLDSTIYMLEKEASVYCRGAPHEQMWSFLNELVYWCGIEHDLRPKFAGFLLSSKKWIDKHQLLSVRNWAGQTILQSAVHHGQLDAVKALVEFGASLEDRLNAVRLPYWNKTNHFWRAYKVKDLDIISFARLLRNSTPRQKGIWAQFIPFEITAEDMDAIIKYLNEVWENAPSQALIHHRSKSIWSGHFSRRKYGVRFQWSRKLGVSNPGPSLLEANNFVASSSLSGG